MGAALAIVKSRAAGGDDILTIELPVHILEAVPDDVGVMEQDATHRPMDQVGRRGEREGVADAARIFGAITVEDNGGQGPVAFCLGIKADGELLGAARECNKTSGWVERSDLAIWRDAHQGGLFIR